MSNKNNPKAHIGEVHGVYELVDVSENTDKYSHYIYKGVCKECGYVKCSHYGSFSGQKSMVTSCNHLDASGQYIIQTKWQNKRIGKIFQGMKARCYNSNDKAYRWYGAKGIKIYNEWLENPKLFEDWALTHGYQDDLTIDRINEDEDYCPNNCQWITGVDNAKYKSTTSLITVNNETHTGKDWATILGLGINIINTYIRKYGLNNTIQFIERYLKNPGLKPKNKQSYYDLYMTIQN